LMGESVPTYLPGYWLSRYFGILPAYLPRDWFLPSELAVPLVDAHYCQDYLIWKRRLDANIRGTHYLVDHLRDPSGTIDFLSIHRSFIEYSFCSHCQSCRTQVVARISHHISLLQWPHTT
jgi:hypothetical protein